MVNLTRSAYMGQQRYATITWSGDVTATWETLRKQIADGLNFCATGSPYWTLDVGAFFVQNKPELWFWSGDYDQGVDDLGYRELFVRWFQYATFLPMLRAHGTDTPREIWRFGEPGEPAYDALVKFLHLRYRLLPYIYSLAGWTTQQRLHDAAAAGVRLPGRSQHVRRPRPVHVRPGLLGLPDHRQPDGSTHAVRFSETRAVYLPAGSDWYDFWTGDRFAGGQTDACRRRSRHACRSMCAPARSSP